ncbi:MAG: hypothetical protein M1820_004663 [Bogoriella megaspora]|nr:MAG: hypothetical protein M1820_004663 [Bogoriella megaspora]
MLGRISFASFLLAVLGPTDRWFRISLWVIIVVQVLQDAAIIIELFTQCGTHTSALWDPNLNPAELCIPLTLQTFLAYFSSGTPASNHLFMGVGHKANYQFLAFNSLSDLWLTILPALVLRSLSLHRNTKWALAAVLCLSLFAFAASLVKTVENANLSALGDFTYNVTKLEIWIVVEINVVILTASAPLIRPLFGAIFRIGGSSRHGSSSKLGGQSRYHNFELGSGRARFGTGRSGFRDHQGTKVEMYAHARETGSELDAPTADGRSEDTILRGHDKGEILRTTDVQIFYE